MLNQEQRILLLYPHKNIDYKKSPVVIKIPFHNNAYDYFVLMFEHAIQLRKDLGIPIKLSEIVLEYKSWVDSIDVSEIVDIEKQLDLVHKLKKSKKTSKYLTNLYQKQLNLKTKKAFRLNPLVEYHICNYDKLHNNFIENAKNYYLPNFLDTLNVHFF